MLNMLREMIKEEEEKTLTQQQGNVLLANTVNAANMIA